MFKKETDLANLFAGLRVSLSTGEGGKIEDSFGQGWSQSSETKSFEMFMLFKACFVKSWVKDSLSCVIV